MLMGVFPTLIRDLVASAAGFPVNERATATALMTLFNYAGVSIGFVLGQKSD